VEKEWWWASEQRRERERERESERDTAQSYGGYRYGYARRRRYIIPFFLPIPACRAHRRIPCFASHGLRLPAAVARIPCSLTPLPPCDPSLLLEALLSSPNLMEVSIYISLPLSTLFCPREILHSGFQVLYRRFLLPFCGFKT